MIPDPNLVYYLFSDPVGPSCPRIEWENPPMRWSESIKANVLDVPAGPIPDRGDMADGVGSGIPEFCEKPVFRVDRSIRDTLLSDIPALFRDIMLLSRRARDRFLRVDPEAFAAEEVKVLLCDGGPGPSYHLCDLVRVINAVDFERSASIEITQRDPVLRFILSPIYERNIFRRSAIRDFHFFRLFNAPRGYYCDAVGAATLLEHPQITGFIPRPMGVLDA